MQIITAAQVHATLCQPEFIDALHSAFAGNYTMPPRQVMLLDPESGSPDAYAMLPCWNEDFITQKSFTYFPGNQPPLATLYSQIMVFNRKGGEPLALIDGVSVTCWRTAGVSALASRLLSREDSATLLLLGTGKLAPFLIKSHCRVRPIQRVMIWGRNAEKAAALAASMAAELPHVTFEVVTDLPAACGEADVIVGATGSLDILVRGEWVKPGTHTDFLGNHHATHRECDTELILKSRVYVDTRVNCFREAGEILVPVAEGVFSLEQVLGELSDLCRGNAVGRTSAEEITLFKSVGCALGDLCGAVATWKKVSAG
jgi:1-pyrroline-2-carboxylate reductase [NAD(P)H]